MTSLKFVRMNTLTNSECREQLADRPQKPPVHDFETICANSGLLGHSTCDGDSGGALVVENKLIGIVSWGYGCGLGFPHGFTRVSTYTDWINKTMATLM